MNSTMGLIGKKLGMTQLFADDGTVIPVTVIETGKNVVLQAKTATTKDGYFGLQLGFGTAKERLVNKPTAGHAKAAGVPAAAEIRELRVDEATVAKFPRGTSIGAADVFKVGELVDAVGTSKGKGFAGVMKRHHFAGFERSHGAHEYFRHGGSIGTRLTPGMTLAGKRMPGQMGNHQVTVQNMEVVKVDAERDLVFVRGGVPGPVGAIIAIRHRVKNIKGKP